MMTRQIDDVSDIDDCIETDGVTVWVNSVDGGCIGRFSRFGLDVHRATIDQETKGQCLDCTHPPEPASWTRFVASMFEYHAVIVPEALRPAWVVA